MNNRSIKERRVTTGPGESIRMPAVNVQTMGAARIIVNKTAEDPELRRKVDARTEYLNSIKLLLS